MTDGQPKNEGHAGIARPAQEMQLRSNRPPVMRLSRTVLVGVGATAAVAIGGALFLALKPQDQTSGSELYDTSNRTTPDGLANLPKDYTGLPKAVPQLGPPLPGDLGRPIANAGAPAPGMPTPGPDPEQQRFAQEQEAARTSHLFATTNLGQSVSAIAQPLVGPQMPAAATPNSSDPILQDHKLAFLNGSVDRRTMSPDRIDAPASPYSLQAGADAEGYAGLEDEVDNHWGMLFKAAILSTILSVGSEAGTSGNSEKNLAQAIRQGGSQSFSQVGEQVVGRSLNIQPTITIRPGFPVRVLVTHDLVLEPYRG